MDFDDSPEEAAFRLECRAFLDEHATPKSPDDLEATSAFARPRSEADTRAHVARCVEWQRTKYEHGWAGLTWPTEFGGRGLSSLLNGVFAEEEARYVVPTGVFSQSIGMVGPTIIVHGSPAQKARHLDPILRGDDIWCQLFSEPGAGSDLAGLRTSAVLDGDEYVVNGQKVWTSGAVHAHWGMLLVRTDVEQPKHRGITYLLVDMDTPGIDIRPLKQINGSAEFNEVFLDDVRVPKENCLGEHNAGWGPILTTLANERQGIGTARQSSITDIVDLAVHFGRQDDPVIRQGIVRLHEMLETIRFLGYRVRTAASRGEQPGPESSVLKLAASRKLEFQGNLVMEIMGPSATLLDDDAYRGGMWQNSAFLSQWASRIGGGTDQVQRNIVGDNVLGLPSEPRLDKGIAFKDIPS